MKALYARLRALQSRLALREELIAGTVLGALAFGVLGFALVTHAGTPAGAALAYMAAVDRDDVDYVWSHSVIDASAAQGADVVLLHRGALEAQLRATAHTRTGLAVQSWRYTATGTDVTLAYSTASGRTTTTLLMKDSSPHFWPVAVHPAGLNLKLPVGSGALAIDGLPLAAADGTELSLAVFPGLHRITLGGSDLYLRYEGETSATATFPATTPITFAGIKLTEQATSEAKRAVAKSFQDCAGQTTLKPAGCPQWYAADVANGAAAWKLTGDPTGDAVAGVGSNGLEVSGHYVMTLSYSSLSRGPRVIALGGPFIASLAWDGTVFSVSGFGDASSVPALARPTATDPEVLSALQAQLTACLKLQAGFDPQCPQSVAAFDASHFVWHASSDPTQSASITWNGAQGFFQVAGNFDFTVDYDSSPPYSPTRHYQDRSSGQYIADIYWDGTKAVFIGFEG